MFNLYNTNQYELIKRESVFNLFKYLEKISFFIIITCLALFLLNFFLIIELKISPLFIGIIFLALFLISKNINIFFNDLKHRFPKESLASAIEKNHNLAHFFNFNTAKYILKALKKNPNPSYSVILYSFLDEKNPKIVFIFSRLLVDLKLLKIEIQKIMNNGNENDLNVIINEAAKIAIKRGDNVIREGDVIAAVSETEPIFKQILIDSELKKQDVENINWWIESTNEKIKKRKQLFSWENLIKNGSIGRDWAFGYTVTLDKFSIDWTKIIEARGVEEIIGHEEEEKIIENVISRKSHKNILILGKPGTGRKILIHQLIKKSLKRELPNEANDKRFLQLDLIALSSRIDSFEQGERIIGECFSEAERAGNVVLILNDFHDFLGGKKKAGITDISGILMTYLSNPKFQMIAISNFEGFHKFIEKKQEILRYFEKIEVNELTPEETFLILEDKVFGLEHEYNKFISYSSIKEIIHLSKKYIPYAFPQKAISLLEDAFAFSNKYNTGRIILPEHIDQIVTDKTQIPVGKIRSKEKETLLNMETLLKKRIISQEDAIREISSALRRSRSGVQDRKGPMGTFLFMGPTGVGKTETAKALAQAYFGSEDRMIRLDMSEFQRIDDIPRLIGDENQEGILTTKVKEDPFSLVLLDEIEKAHPDILNLFLHVLDEGYVNDNLGNKISFANTIIIATSNAGYQVVLDAIKTNTEMEDIKKDILDYIFKNAIFRPEFINRFDGVIVFKALTKEDLIKITHLQLEKIKKTLTEKHVDLIITQELKEEIVELSYDPVFGAREIKRKIQDKVENAIAKALLNNTLKNGDKIKIDPKTFEVISINE
jgi:ATP-dependent Clp protease ATP-binding subunit ClpA